jgi:hypothetical protein
MTDDAFSMPPEGKLSEQIALPDHRMALGLLHIEGAGVRVVVWDGELYRHMAQAAARRWARELSEGPFASAYAPVADGLNTLADRVDEINATVTANREAIAAGLGEMEVEGRA